jgi:hypothetical protein
MPSLSNILHRKSPAPPDAPSKGDFVPAPPGPPPGHPQANPEDPPPSYRAANAPDPNISQYRPPQFAPGTGPAAHAQTHQANNIGMGVGALMGSVSGGNPVMGMIEGQVGANMIAQRIHQEQTHQYYRQQAINYRNGLPADGVGDAGHLAPAVGGGRNRSSSRSPGRDERRKRRWERRANRRDGGGRATPSGSDSG